MTLSSLCALDRVVHALELGEHESDGRFVTLRSARDGREIELCGWLFLPVELWLGIRVDEHDLDAIPSRRGDEEELVSVRNRLLDDRRCERREQVPLDGTLERTGAELRTEPLLDQERIRRLVHLDRPWPSSETSTRQGIRELLVEQRPHRRALERTEDDDPIEPVHELGSERGSNGAFDTRVRERAICWIEADT